MLLSVSTALLPRFTWCKKGVRHRSCTKGDHRRANDRTVGRPLCGRGFDVGSSAVEGTLRDRNVTFCPSGRLPSVLRSQQQLGVPLSFQVRIHGRGGQGAVTAAEMLSVAAFADGRWAQAFPSFGSERSGAPVESFCRIDDRPIRTREPVLEPDALIVLDVTLIHQVDLFAGLATNAYVLLNTSRPLEDLGLGVLVSEGLSSICTCPATELALAELGRPLPNAALLGGFAAQTKQVSLASVQAAVRERFSGTVAEQNARAVTRAYAAVGEARKEVVGAAPD